MASDNEVTFKRDLDENQGQVTRRLKEFEDILRNEYSLQQVTDKRNQFEDACNHMSGKLRGFTGHTSLYNSYYTYLQSAQNRVNALYQECLAVANRKVNATVDGNDALETVVGFSSDLC